MSSLSPIKAQLAVDVSTEEAARLLQSSAYVAQEKVDGERWIVDTDESGTLRVWNRSGSIASRVPATFRLTLPPLSRLDTEYLARQRHLIVLDLLAWHGEAWHPRPMLDRYRALCRLRDAGLLPVSCRLVPTAITLEDKLRLSTTLLEEHAEGLILKAAEAPYTVARALWGNIAPVRRRKFRKRMEVILRRRPQDTRRSFTMWAIGPGNVPIYVGDVSAHGFYNQLVPGGAAVAEVSYLYATENRQLYQPTIERWRQDKTALECTIDQAQVGKRYLTPA